MVSFDLIQIQENIKRLPKDCLNKLDKRSIKGLFGMRNHLVHEYEGIDELLVINAIKNELPTLVYSITDVVYHSENDKLIGQKIEIADVYEEEGCIMGFYKNVITPKQSFQRVKIIDCKSKEVDKVEVVLNLRGHGLDEDLLIAKEIDCVRPDDYRTQ